MTQSRTHNCNELRLSNAGEKVTLVRESPQGQQEPGISYFKRFLWNDPDCR